MARVLRQLGFKFKTWGGARAGAGRPPNGERAGVSHLRRPSHSRHYPLHVTLKVKRGLPSLREQALFVRVRTALAAAKRQFGFALVHFSVQRDHLHLIAEAENRRALSRGVQGLAIRVALAVNRRLERKGRLFADRYHARALKTPREVKFAVRYVLLNARKHAARTPKGSAGACARGAATPSNSAQWQPESRDPQGCAAVPARRRPTRVGADSSVQRAPAQRRQTLSTDVPAGFVDSRSSAPWFASFSRPEGLAFGAREARAGWLRLQGPEPPVVPAASGLLRKVLQRTDLFDVDETPGAQ